MHVQERSPILLLHQLSDPGGGGEQQQNEMHIVEREFNINAPSSIYIHIIFSNAPSTITTAVILHELLVFI
jgi:hypothetical protein